MVKKVSELISKHLITIDKNSPIRNALKLMKKEGISRLLVKSKGKIVGIVTERDLMKRLGSEKERKLSDAHIYVSSCYTKNLIKIKKDADVKEAARLMLKHSISSLIVEDEEKIVGILTKTDLIKALEDSSEKVEKWMKKKVTILKPEARVLEARKLMIMKNIKRIPIVSGNSLVGIVTERDIAQALGLFRKVSEGRHWDERLKQIYVEQIMSKDLVVVKPSDTLGKCVKLMLENGISGLPVIEEGKLVGIITKTDLIRVLAESTG
ncbi:MAG: CBS domain-containing protein [Candidatus Aenigmarchaeota archaeon]|nr:CBS domain-containing protein [Candidatus Aenigmarchaeota archaeon]